MNPFIASSLLGFKHALDPDHIAATLNMTLSGKVHGWSAARLGTSWGFGHALSMLVLGLPVVLFTESFPTWVYTSSELIIGIVIVVLGIQLFMQWFKGEFHPHEIQKLRKQGENHQRSHKRAGLMGVLHGIGGSYPAAILMLASFSTSVSATIGLIVFVLLSILSMSLTTVLFSFAALHHIMMHVLDRLLLPIFIILTIWFGFNYIEEAINALKSI